MLNEIEELERKVNAHYREGNVCVVLWGIVICIVSYVISVPILRHDEAIKELQKQVTTLQQEKANNGR